MPSLRRQFEILVSTNTHNLFDRALRNGSTRVVDAYIYESQRTLNDLESRITHMGESVSSLRDRIDELLMQVNQLDRNIDVLLTRGKNELATAAQADLTNRRHIAEEYQQQLQGQEQELHQFLQARLLLDSRLNMIRHQRERLRRLIEQLSHLHTPAIHSLHDVEVVEDANVRDLSHQIVEALHQVNADSVGATVLLRHTTRASTTQSTIQVRLEERRRRLGIESEV